VDKLDIRHCLVFMIALCLVVLVSLAGCGTGNSPAGYPEVDREAKLPSDITKREPMTDQYPPILHTAAYEKPVPVPYPVSTRGAEDSPFVMPDGHTLYFFFTPDVRVPPEKQLLDGVTGVWLSHMNGGTWAKPERVWLQEPGKLSLDGAVSIQDDEMWFASVREGFTGANMFIAQWVNGRWDRVRYAGDHLMKKLQIGEVHIYDDELYFHSERAGGKGGYDIWRTTRHEDTWSDPVNIASVNSDAMDGYPFISPDGTELWFTRTYQGTPAAFRSTRENGSWSEPVLVVSQFAGEPTLDANGNLYFVHHYYEDGLMTEADIYVAYRK